MVRHLKIEIARTTAAFALRYTERTTRLYTLTGSTETPSQKILSFAIAAVARATLTTHTVSIQTAGLAYSSIDIVIVTETLRTLPIRGTVSTVLNKLTGNALCLPKEESRRAQQTTDLICTIHTVIQTHRATHHCYPSLIPIVPRHTLVAIGPISTLRTVRGTLETGPVLQKILLQTDTAPRKVTRSALTRTLSTLLLLSHEERSSTLTATRTISAHITVRVSTVTQ